ncbi:hypothetical protein OAJ09_00840 [Candidatus Pelagibacter sp.]|nr:hypothetical protein [Candidatus Pelagibacter sp.]
MSFYFGENSTGGAIIDYFGQKKVSEDFAIDFGTTLLNYDQYATRHSPALIIILSFFEKLKISDELIRLIHLHFCLILPLIFYFTLKEKYSSVDKRILFLLAGLIFISPTFRSLSIWPDSRLLGLAFFNLSIFFFIKFERNKKISYCYYTIIAYTLSSYLSPNFSVFALFFVIKFFMYYGLKSINLYLLILLNLILALPAFYYVFILKINFLNKPAGIGIDDANIIFRNIFNQILIIPTLILFYLLPFLFTRTIKIKFNKQISSIIFSLIIFVISLYYFDYKFEFTGGGIFFKISYFIFKNNFLFYAISLVSIFIILQIINKKFYNSLILLLIILNNPQETIYHKYFDPFLIISFFLLFDFKTNIGNIKKLSNSLIIYIYFFIFLLLSIAKNYV